MTTVDIATPHRALAIGAHPDDIEFGCGATLAKWAAAGCEIFHLVCTDGAKGSWDADESTAQLVVRREEEQREAAQRLGGRRDVIFLGWPDGELESGLRQRAQVAGWIRRIEPDVVLAHDPWKRYRLHPDHRNAGFLATDGIVAARDPLFFPELAGKAHRPAALLLFEADTPDHLEDVSTSFEQKITALLAHRSQLMSTMDIHAAPDDPDYERQVAAFVERTRKHLAIAGEAAGIALAEAFKLIDPL